VEISVLPAITWAAFYVVDAANVAHVWGKELAMTENVRKALEWADAGIPRSPHRADDEARKGGAA
jgi:hypothetical protein